MRAILFKRFNNFLMVNVWDCVLCLFKRENRGRKIFKANKKGKQFCCDPKTHFKLNILYLYKIFRTPDEY